MSRYIDADALLKHTTDHEMISTHLIYNAPTADVVEVVHGEWVDYSDTWKYRFECSLCKFHLMGYDKTNYCPNCGADMRGGSNDGRGEATGLNDQAVPG